MATPARHREWLSQQDDGAVAYVVAWLGERPVGQGLIHWPGPRNRDLAAALGECPEIYSLGVLEGFRSRGIGSRIVRALEELASTRGCSRAGLAVALANPEARSLYESLGYRRTDTGTFIDRWRQIDAAGQVHVEEDECEFLVKSLRPERHRR
ncbi:MAG: GNAT family N-acetyltransferase [Myxococcota bacterium]